MMQILGARKKAVPIIAPRAFVVLRMVAAPLAVVLGLSVAGAAVAGQARLLYAKCFTLEYTQGCKVLRVLSPWRDARVSFTCVLVPRGTKPPEDAPHGPGVTVLEVPVRRIVMTSISFVPMLALLGEEPLVGFTGLARVHTPAVAARIAQGLVSDVSAGGGSMIAMNMERLELCRPEAVLVQAGGNPETDVHDKLREAGFPTLVEGSFMESSALGRAEWIKFLAALFDKEDRAEALFADMVARYRDIAVKARNLDRRPKVLSGTPYRGLFHVPGGASFMAGLLADAGGDYLWKEDDSRGSIPLGLEAVVDKAAQAEIWVQVGAVRSLEELAARDERLTMWPCFQQGLVFNNDLRVDRNGENQFWEESSSRPDELLADIMGVIHPELLPGRENVWFHRLPARADEVAR